MRDRSYYLLFYFLFFVFFFLFFHNITFRNEFIHDKFYILIILILLEMRLDQNIFAPDRSLQYEVVITSTLHAENYFLGICLIVFLKANFFSVVSFFK